MLYLIVKVNLLIQMICLDSDVPLMRNLVKSKMLQQGEAFKCEIFDLFIFLFVAGKVNIQ